MCHTFQYASRFGKKIKIGCSGWWVHDPPGTHRWMDLDPKVDKEPSK